MRTMRDIRVAVLCMKRLRVENIEHQGGIWLKCFHGHFEER